MEEDAKLLVTPNCRYDHGNLVRVKYRGADKWAFVGTEENGIHFGGQLFVCTTCGYTEFFDDDVEQTIADLRDL